MAKDPREQQKVDAERIGEHGTGKLDDTKHKDAVVHPEADDEEQAAGC